MNDEILDEKLLADLPENVVHHIELLGRMRKDFVANVSHELRTPLTVVMGYLETLLVQDEAQASPENKIYQKMLRQTQRMQNIIEDLLVLSRIETNQAIPTSESTVDVHTLINTILQNAETLAQAKQQNITTDIEAMLQITGNQEELHSLFSNLVFNAIKYTPDGGDIKIHWYKKGNQAIFSVQDTGIGIAKKYIPRLTERFYRIDKGRSRESGGTGLGLAICKHILIRHQGSLEIESQEKQGSTFTCSFPLDSTLPRS